MMKNSRKFKNLKYLYKKTKELYTLHEIRQESLYFCYEENKDYSHIFALDTILTEKFKILMKDFEEITEKLQL